MEQQVSKATDFSVWKDKVTFLSSHDAFFIPYTRRQTALFHAPRQLPYDLKAPTSSKLTNRIEGEFRVPLTMCVRTGIALRPGKLLMAILCYPTERLRRAPVVSRIRRSNVED